MFRVLRLLLVGLIIVVLAGCKGGGDGDNNDTTNTIIHNGTACGTVTSPYTGKVWLDRNLGATRVCERFDDEACYGDYYQWGRGADGHEDMYSSTTNSQAADVDNVGHGYFIVGTTSSYGDWARDVDKNLDKRITNWSKTDGSSICPEGFRVPTVSEFIAEIGGIKSRDDAYDNFLKLPSSGRRMSMTGDLKYVNEWGVAWTISTKKSDDENYLLTGLFWLGSKRRGCSIGSKR